MTAPYEKVPDEDKFGSILLGMRRQIDELTNSVRRTPVYDKDPSDPRINLWMLTDGRLRGRHPRTGAILEYATTTTGSSTSSTPLPAAAAPRALLVKTYIAAWSATYDATSGSQVSATTAQFGKLPRTNTTYSALIGMPTALKTDLTGKTPTKVEVNFILRDTGGNDVVAVPLYYATNAPNADGSYSAISASTPPVRYPVEYMNIDSSAPRVIYESPVDTSYVNVTASAFLDALAAGTVGALAIPPLAIGVDNYGEIASTGNPFASAFQVRVTYYN